MKGTGQIRDLGESLHLYRVGLPFLDDEMILDDSYGLKPKLSLSPSLVGKRKSQSRRKISSGGLPVHGLF